MTVPFLISCIIKTTGSEYQAKRPVMRCDPKEVVHSLGITPPPDQWPALGVGEGKSLRNAASWGRHGNVAVNIAIILGGYIRSNNLGRTFVAETGFILRRVPDTVRAPDFAFVASGRLAQGIIPVGYVELAPDLAVEVVSPSDRRREVREKAEDWLRAGVHLV